MTLDFSSDSGREALCCAAETAAGILSEFQKIPVKIKKPVFLHGISFFSDDFSTENCDIQLFNIRSSGIWFIAIRKSDSENSDDTELIELTAKSFFSSLCENTGFASMGRYIKFRLKNRIPGVLDQILSESALAETALDTFTFKAGEYSFLALIPAYGKKSETTQPPGLEIPSHVAYQDTFIKIAPGISTPWFSSSIAVIGFSPSSPLFMGLFSAYSLMTEKNRSFACNPLTDMVNQLKSSGEVVHIMAFGGANILLHPIEKFLAGFKNWQFFDTISRGHGLNVSLCKTGCGCMRLELDCARSILRVFEDPGGVKEYDFTIQR